MTGLVRALSCKSCSSCRKHLFWLRLCRSGFFVVNPALVAAGRAGPFAPFRGYPLLLICRLCNGLLSRAYGVSSLRSLRSLRLLHGGSLLSPALSPASLRGRGRRIARGGSGSAGGGWNGGQRLHHAGLAQEARHADYSAVPLGLAQYGIHGPALKRRAIFMQSLRDSRRSRNNEGTTRPTFFHFFLAMIRIYGII